MSGASRAGASYNKLQPKGKGKPLQVKGKGKVTVAASIVTAEDDNSDENSSVEDEENEDEKSAMLAALQAHNRMMLGLDGPDQAESSTAARKRLGSEMDSDQGDLVRGETDSEDDEDFHTDDGWGADDGFVTDSEDEFSQTNPPKQQAIPVVVFAPISRGPSDVLSKAERRAFLNGNSAKMMGLKHVSDYGPLRKKQRVDEAVEDKEDQSNLKLDKTLHEMLVNNLLPTATLSTASRPVDKRNAIQGRLLELSSYTLPGEGHSSAATSNSRLSSHSAKVRTGILKAQQKRDEKRRAEEKESGNWVRGMGGLGDAKKQKRDDANKQRARVGEDVGKKKGMDGRKKGDAARDRGLGMGVGKFENGMLRLSEREIARGSGQSGRGFKKGKGGKRGKRGGKR